MNIVSTFDVAGSALSAQQLRLNLTASNLANMHDVAGDPAEVYRARHALFRASRETFSKALAGVDVLGIVESESPPIERYDPGHPEATADGLVFAANVNPMEELANMISASRSYQNNLEVLNTAKDLMLRTLSLGQV
jgi:flagellar basal-body rod protein FlgC